MLPSPCLYIMRTHISEDVLESPLLVALLHLFNPRSYTYMQVLPGPNTKFHNDVAAINIKERSCCRIGSSAKFVTVTPDVESLLNSAPDMETHE